jgi:hypothetical protein
MSNEDPPSPISVPKCGKCKKILTKCTCTDSDLDK